MFLKVLNKVNFRAHKPKLFHIIDLLPFVKLLKLLAINHSLSERRIICVPWLLKLSHVLFFFITCMVVHFPELSWIVQSGLAPFPGCQGSCGIVPNGPADLVISFHICQGLKCQHVASTPTLTM